MGQCLAIAMEREPPLLDTRPRPANLVVATLVVILIFMEYRLNKIILGNSIKFLVKVQHT